jgi:hypothetical protein
MSAKTARASRDTTAEIAYLTRALKAPTLRESAVRLAERARAESWSHEEYLVACLQREVSARESHGGEGRVRASRFPARKSLEKFDFDHARGLQRDTIAHLGTLGFVTAAPPEEVQPLVDMSDQGLVRRPHVDHLGPKPTDASAAGVAPPRDGATASAASTAHPVGQDLLARLGGAGDDHRALQGHEARHGLSRPRRGRGQIVLVSDDLESAMRQPIASIGHRHREDRPDTAKPPIPRQPPLVFTMTPHTTRSLVLTGNDAANPIPSAAQHSSVDERGTDRH